MQNDIRNFALMITITAFVYSGGCVVDASASSNPFLPYFLQNRGCTQATGYSHPPIMGKTFLGKPMEDWTDEDVVFFKGAVQECIQMSGRHETNGPAVYIENMLRYVDSARLRRQQSEAQVKADAEIKRRDVEQEAIKAANDELVSFRGHEMTVPEVQRAEQLKEEFPALTAQIDGLLSAQEHLKQDFAKQEKEDQEKRDFEARMALESKKRVVAREIAEQEKSIEEEKHMEQFNKNLPSSCQKANSLQGELNGSVYKTRLERALAFVQAGDVTEACGTYSEIVAKTEAARSAYVQCTKDLDANNDALAVQAAQSALARAGTLHQISRQFAQKVSEMDCNR